MLYKKRYMIGLYKSNDETVAILENSKQLAEYCKTDERVCRSILTRVSNGTQKSIVVGKTKCDIFLIDMEEEDDE